MRPGHDPNYRSTDPAYPASSKIFRIISITKYFEKYFNTTFEIFRNYFRNISKPEIFRNIFQNISKYIVICKIFRKISHVCKIFRKILLYKFADETNNLL